jgi:cytidylate kinase
MNASPKSKGEALAVPVVTIDGPSGAGKGTVSRRLASKLGWNLLDSGALYRLVALAGRKAGLSEDDRSGHAGLARSLDSRFAVRADGSELIELNGSDVTLELRSEQGGKGASRVAVWPEVRQALLARQHAFAAAPGLVADGRDMGTVVFTDAPHKIFLTAAAEERAKRRYKQLKEKGLTVTLSSLLHEIEARDERDATRKVAPLKAAPGALIIDTTGIPVADVVAQVLAVARSR